MSENLGNLLPDHIMKLVGSEIEKRENSVIVIVTAGSDGFPHAALLSPYQVIASGRDRLTVAVHGITRTASNLISSGKGMLVTQAGPAVQYLKCTFKEMRECRIRQGETEERVFQAIPAEVLEDGSSRAPFVSFLRFEESRVRSMYSKEFRDLLAKCTGQ